MENRVCMGGKCTTCWSGMIIVVGLVFLANAYNWFGIGMVNWWVLIGLILVVKGVLGLMMPTCPHCSPNGSGSMMASKKRR